MNVFGVRLVGLNQASLHKLFLTALFVGAILVIRGAIRWALRRSLARHPNERVAFWSRQGTSLASAVLIALALLSIWFDDPRRLTTGLGLVSAGLAFALQKVVTSFAGYLVIMRGRTFTVGDRITMGGVRGDVVALGFIQTAIMEMGEPPAVQGAAPAVWVAGRQFTGRIVTVTNDKIFDEPVYNYTREFPFLWEEIHLPVKYDADHARAERILKECVERNTRDWQSRSEEARRRLEARYPVRLDETLPKTYYRLTDNWVELSVRFLAPEHGVREIKDRISRELLQGLSAAGIGVASATFELVGAPRLEISLQGSASGPRAWRES
jgi:small-conductance mechanosensitive channel